MEQVNTAAQIARTARSKRRPRPSMAWSGLMLAAYFWLFAALVDVFVFERGSLLRLIVQPEPVELWMRFSVCVFLVAFGFYGQRWSAERSARDRHISRLNRLLTLLSEVNQAIVRVGSRQALFDNVCRIATGSGGFRCAWIGLLDPADGRAVLLAHAGDERCCECGPDGSVRLLEGFDGPIEHAAQRGAPTVYNDLHRCGEAGAWRQQALACGLGSCVVMPLRRGRRTWGVAVVYAAEPNYFEQDEVRLLGEVAEDIAFAVLTVEREEHRQRAEEALEHLSRQNELILNSAGDGILGLDAEGRTTFVNPAAARMLLYRPQELMGIRQHDLIHHTRADGTRFPAAECPIYHAFSDGAVHHVSQDVFWRQDGTPLAVEYSSTPTWQDGVLSGTVVTFRDITERLRAQETLRHRDAILEATGYAAAQFLRSRDWAAGMEQALARLGSALGACRAYLFENSDGPPRIGLERCVWARAGAPGLTTDGQRLTLPWEQEGFTEWAETLSRGEVVHGDPHRQPHAAGDGLGAPGATSVALVPVFVGDDWWGAMLFAMCVAEREWHAAEIDALRLAAATLGAAVKRRRTEDQMLYDAFHDRLSGLPNRALFLDRLGRTVERSKRHSRSLFAVLVLDIDSFKLINDSLGHAMGDELLAAVARRLERLLRTGDTVARLGGDEFGILLDDIRDGSDATRVSERMQAEMAQPFDLNGHEVFASASIGIAVCGDADMPPEHLLRDADTALYRAKALGKARHEIFDADMHARAVARLQLETDLRRALERDELCVYYQPMVCLATGRLASFEALLRWQHPQRGLLPPAEFIPLAEETGLIVPIGAWVLRRACEQMRLWAQALGAHLALVMSVNLSSKQFAHPDLVTEIAQILNETGMDASRLILEITESVIMEHAESTNAVLGRLRGLNIRLSVDDFGTGYSSLSYLHRFPLDSLKIDRSFVGRVGEGKDNVEIIRTIVALAHNLGLEVIAEGVETVDQLTCLRGLGCEYAQGYLFSKPLEAEAAGRLIATAPKW